MNSYEDGMFIGFFFISSYYLFQESVHSIFGAKKIDAYKQMRSVYKFHVPTRGQNILNVLGHWKVAEWIIQKKAWHSYLPCYVSDCRSWINWFFTAYMFLSSGLMFEAASNIKKKNCFLLKYCLNFNKYLNIDSLYKQEIIYLHNIFFIHLQVWPWSWSKSFPTKSFSHICSVSLSAYLEIYICFKG